VASGVSNVVLGWPMLAALAHTAGAAALVTLLTMLLMRGHQAKQGPHLKVVAGGRGAAPLSSVSQGRF
jgi:cytochrome c oxidase assembly protein subunit 15